MTVFAIAVAVTIAEYAGHAIEYITDDRRFFHFQNIFLSPFQEIFDQQTDPFVREKIINTLFDIIKTSRLFPVIADNSAKNVNSIDCNTFKHTISARFFSSPNYSQHFADFKRGLGFSSKRGEIVTETARHKLLFCQNPTSHCDVIVVWDECMSTKDIVATYTQDSVLRFDIAPMQTGLFTVTVSVSKQLPTELVPLKTTIVSKRALSLFVISNIMTCIHIIHKNNDNVIEPFVISGNVLNRIRNSEFHSHSIMLMCAKKILQEIE